MSQRNPILLIARVVGSGALALAAAAVPPPAHAGVSFTAVGEMASERYFHTSTLLPDGRVLIAGGRTANATTNTAELFDPATGVFAPLPLMSSPRRQHTATVLPGGKVLLAGGHTGTAATNSAEIFDPATRAFTLLGPTMISARHSHTATLLQNGKVLLAGGYDGSAFTASAELFDPGSQTFTALPPMTAPHYQHTATLLQSGKVLIAGGGNTTSDSTNVAELYDPGTGPLGGFIALPSLTLNRTRHAAALLPDGRVLVAGGYDGNATTATVELFDPAAGAAGGFALSAPMSSPRQLNTATLLSGGRVLLAGGDSVGPVSDTGEIFDPTTGVFRSLAPTKMTSARAQHAATLLFTGRVLLTGGDTGASPFGTGITRTAEIFDPVGSSTPDPSCLPDALCPEWTKRYDGAALYDRAQGVVSSPDGARVYVMGASTSIAGGPDLLTVAYAAATGQQLWTARYDGPSHGNDGPFIGGSGNPIAVAADGSRVFVTTSSADSSGKNEYVTIAYETANGAPAWINHFTTPQDSQATSLALSGDGQRLYVTGFSALALATGGTPNYDFGTVAYDTATGNEIWIARYEGPAAFWDIAYDLGVASVRQPDGSRGEQVFVTGRSNGASSANSAADFATVAYDGATGAQLWAARYDGPAHDRDLPYALGTSPDGASVFITGESVGNGTSSDYATVSYDAVTGAQRWVARYEQGDLDLALGLAVSPLGNRVAVTGFSVNPVEGIGFAPLRDAATIVYDTATGAQVWAARHGEVDGAAAVRVLFSRDGRRLYVAGLENGNVVGVGGGPVGGQVGHAPALSLAYETASGAEVWATHYLGPTGDEGNTACTLSPDGAHLFVTGGGQGQDADLATVSYPTGDFTPLPDLTLSKSHVEDLRQGQEGAAYNLTVRNSGAGATSGVVTVVDTLPAGLSAVSLAGTGWDCDLPTLTCARADALAGGSSYPAITLTVDVAADAPASLTNTAAVSGGGELATANDAASDPTTIVPVVAGYDFYTAAPCRVLDTRQSGGALSSGVARTLTIGGNCGIPLTAKAVSFNFTATAPTAAGSVAFYPDAGSPPVTGTIHFSGGQARANNQVLALAASGDSTLQVQADIPGGGSVQVIVDVNGWLE